MSARGIAICTPSIRTARKNGRFQPKQIDSSPAIGSDGTVYIGSEDTNLYALNPNGSQQWAFNAGCAIDSSPSLGSDGSVYVGSANGLFAIAWPTFVVTPSAGANGTITPSTPQTVRYGNNVSFSATPDLGYQINSWLLDGATVQKGGNNFSVNNVMANHTVQVTFVLLNYTVTPIAGTNGLINPNTIQSVNYGSNLTFTAIPNAGYAERHLVGRRQCGSIRWFNVYVDKFTSNHTVEVTFAKLYGITPVAGPNGAISPNTVQQVMASDSISFTATPNANYAVNTWSVDGTVVQNGGTLFTLANITADHTVLVTFTSTVITAVTLSVAPAAPQLEGTPITLTATPTYNGGQVQYMFRAGCIDSNGNWVWANLNANYTASATCVWTPSMGGTYMLVVWARLVGHNGNYDQFASCNYLVTVPTLTAVALAASPASPQITNTAIKLTATPTFNGGTVQYLFRVGYMSATGLQWSNISTGYSNSASCTWTPTVAGSYYLVVWGRIVGSSNNYDQYAMIPYTVLIPPITNVVLTTTPASPQFANTVVKLTAAVTGGGGQVQYMFRVGYTNASGWVWTNLTSAYTTIPTVNWTPATANTYTLVVWARIIGHTASYDKFASTTYQVTYPPITALTLNVNPASPQYINKAITLTANVTGGGGQVQYDFRAGYISSTGIQWTDLTNGYTTSSLWSWTPTAGSYIICVWARLIGHTANYDKYAFS